MEPESSSPYSQVPATRPYPEPTPSSPHDPLQLPEDHFTLPYLYKISAQRIFLCINDPYQKPEKNIYTKENSKIGFQYCRRRVREIGRPRIR